MICNALTTLFAKECVFASIGKGAGVRIGFEDFWLIPFYEDPDLYGDFMEW